MITLDKEYYALVERMPLVHITNDEHLTEAGEVLDELVLKQVRNEITAAEKAYLEVLTDLIVKYETKRFPREKVTPIQLVEALMEANNLTQSDMAPIFGSQPRVSDFLSGKRQLSKGQIARLCKEFSLSSDAFFNADND